MRNDGSLEGLCLFASGPSQTSAARPHSHAQFHSHESIWRHNDSAGIKHSYHDVICARRRWPLALTHLWSTTLSAVARGRRAQRWKPAHTRLMRHRFRTAAHTTKRRRETAPHTQRTQARLFSTARRLVPIADRVLVKRVEHKTQTAGGIYLPTEQKVNEADVVAVGPGATDESGKLIPMEVAVGDSVLLPEYGATAVNIGEEEFHLLRASDILGKFEG